MTPVVLISATLILVGGVALLRRRGLILNFKVKGSIGKPEPLHMSASACTYDQVRAALGAGFRIDENSRIILRTIGVSPEGAIYWTVPGHPRETTVQAFLNLLPGATSEVDSQPILGDTTSFEARTDDPGPAVEGLVRLMFEPDEVLQISPL